MLAAVHSRATPPGATRPSSCPTSADLDHAAGGREALLPRPAQAPVHLAAHPSLQFEGDSCARSATPSRRRLIPVRDRKAPFSAGTPGGPRPRRAVRLAAAAVLLAATGCTLQGTGDKGYVSGDGAIRQIAVADRSPVALSGKDLDGRPLSLATMHGKPTVVSVWGAWCADCHKESPYVVAAAKNWARRPTSSASTAATRPPGQGLPVPYGITWPSFSPGGERCSPSPA